MSQFTDTERNRGGLDPRPAELPDERCLHAGVLRTDAAEGFSRERGHPVFPVRVPARSVSISVGVIEPGEQTGKHRHAYEAVMYVMAGRGHSVVEGTRYEWQAGDALYVPPWCWHQHFAERGSRVEYVTATNMPTLEALGQTVLRQEA
jgi:quercetin dioxygenase-like cupin family protein